LPERRVWQGGGSAGTLSYSRGIYGVEEENAAWQGLNRNHIFAAFP